MVPELSKSASSKVPFSIMRIWDLFWVKHLGRQFLVFPKKCLGIFIWGVFATQKFSRRFWLRFLEWDSFKKTWEMLGIPSWHFCFFGGKHARWVSLEDDSIALHQICKHFPRILSSVSRSSVGCVVFISPSELAIDQQQSPLEPTRESRWTGHDQSRDW